MSRALPTGRTFQLQFLFIVGTSGILTAAFVIGYVMTLLRMTKEQMEGLLWIVLVLFTLATPISQTTYIRSFSPIRDWLNHLVQGETSEEQAHLAFERIANLPRRAIMYGILNFMIPAAIAVVGLYVWFPDFQVYSAVLMMAACSSAALIVGIVNSYFLKSWLGPVREHLTAVIADPAVRAELTTEVSITAKLQFVIAASAIVPVVFVAFMLQSRTFVPVENLANAMQQELLAEALEIHREAGDAGLVAMQDRIENRAFPVGLVVFDAETHETVVGDVGQLQSVEIESIVSAVDSGLQADSLNSKNLYVWAHRPEADRIVVIASPRDALVGDRVEIWVFVGFLLGGCFLLAIGLAHLVAKDLGSGMDRLRAAAMRMSSGDLRRVDVCESEDEIGALGRSFEVMASSLHGLVGEVAGAADDLDRATRSIVDVADGLAHSASEQRQEVKQVSVAMEEVGKQVSGIAGNSEELSQLVDESTSSLLELGATGEQLNQTAGVFSDRVDQVSSSVEDMVASVREVGRNTESLSDAATETSSSMEEMASAMRTVDSTAAETSEVSDQVVKAAERGQARVIATVEGIQSIRAATESAQEVILSLGSRTQEIGSILDVIDEVADETNLLALNAAIIAAQAGEHGRAFSVVADEIKELADRVLASTKEIGGLIRAVQKESQSAIDAMDEGSRSVAAGVERSNEAGEALEEIGRFSKESEIRMQGILNSVREETTAAGHVVTLMDTVREGVGSIRSATAEQERGNEVVYRSTQDMREAAQQLHVTTSEQTLGLGRIRESVEGVRDAMEAINGSLQGQSVACNRVVGFLEEVSSRSMASESSTSQMGETTRELLALAEKLRENVSRFTR